MGVWQMLLQKLGWLCQTVNPSYCCNNHGCYHAHRGNGAITLGPREPARVLAFAHKVLLFLLVLPIRRRNAALDKHDSRRKPIDAARPKRVV